MHILSPRACTKSFFRAMAADREAFAAIRSQWPCQKTARASVLAGQSLPSRNHLQCVQRRHATGFSQARVLPAHAGSARCPRPTATMSARPFARMLSASSPVKMLPTQMTGRRVLSLTREAA